MARADLEGHVKTCDACKHEEAIDSVMDVALSRLTAEPPPSSTGLPPLRTRIETAHADARAVLRRRVVWGLFGLFMLGVIVVVFPRSYVEPDGMVHEAVNDHVRILSASSLVEVPGDTIDKVTPQLATRLDFAPVNGFSGDAEVKLVGASVAYYVDRKAAAFVYQRESHVVTAFVFRADGLPWRGPRYTVTTRGYRAVIFRHGDLGYAIVSDLPEVTLVGLAGKIDAP